MKIGPNCLFRAVVAIGLLLSSCTYHACAQTVVTKSGLTVVRSSLGSRNVEIRVNAVRVDQGSSLFPAIEWGAKAVTLVQSLRILVDGRDIFVFRSAFADLVDPRTVAVKFQKGGYVLEIVGADGAETYLVRLHFSATQTTRRMVYNALDQTLGEDTHYWLAVLKDK